MRSSLTTRLSDAGQRQRPTKLIYADHRLPPWLTEDAPRDRSNRLLGGAQLMRPTRIDYYGTGCNVLNRTFFSMAGHENERQNSQ
jgi:hypothetical protein